MKKKILLLLAAAAAATALLSGGSLAYYTVSQIATNVVTTGGMSVDIHETTEDGTEFPADGVSILPGDTVSKIVQFENTGTAPMYLRVKLTKGVRNDTLSAEDCMALDLNTEDWTLKDGYYYYNEALEPEDITVPLFTEVHFNGSAIGNAYLGKSFTLDVTAYAVQQANNGDTALDAAGWPAD